MQRIVTPPRPHWRKQVESQGLLFHTIDGEPYWDEGAYYLFEASEIDLIERATQELDAMCLSAVDHIISEGRLGDLAIPEEFHPFVEASWERDEHTIYGRFDLSYDGLGPPKLLEYNADTPTSLLEAAVIQWFWMKDLVEPLDEPDRAMIDQFNSLHERLIEAWRRVGRELGGRIVFASIHGSIEDLMTATYLRDTAIQAGLKAEPIDISQIGWNGGRRVFTDLRERAVPLLFKLYPWEWMIREAFGQHLMVAPSRWLEPPWKMVLSNKAILPILVELFPESPYLLDAALEPIGETYVVKPIHSREGANVEIVVDGEILARTGGEYAEGLSIYQEYHPLPDFDGRRPVIGSWMVNGHACGIGIREDDGPITRNTSRFMPHVFRTMKGIKPPLMEAKSTRNDRLAGAGLCDNPLWDAELDS